MVKALLFAAIVVGCAPLAPVRAVTPADVPKAVEIADHKAAYEKATALAIAGDLDGAIAQLEPFVRATANRTDEPLAYWIHNQLTWLHWGKGDLKRALAETDAGSDALDRSKLPKDEIESMRLHALWDRAYLFIELRDPRAGTAFGAYELLAKAKNDHDGLAVLTAFFAARDHRAADAAAVAKEVDVEKDADLQDLYVIALAIESAGDASRADTIRARICTAKPYLMKPLITAQLAREGHPCAHGN